MPGHDATDVTDRVVADAEQLHSTSEFDVHAVLPREFNIQHQRR